jgi:hypothetical protein
MRRRTSKRGHAWAQSKLKQKYMMIVGTSRWSVVNVDARYVIGTISFAYPMALHI